MLPLIVRPALVELLGVPGEQPAWSTIGSATSSSCRPSPAASSACSAAISLICSAAAACSPGASCSTPFGTLAAGYATSVQWLLFWRCCTFVGVCVEFVAAVAWLAELFPNPKQREAVIGYTQAFGSLGGVAGHRALLSRRHLRRAACRRSTGGHEAWRYTLMSGVIPALPLILIRPFLPESPTWQQKKTAGTLKRPSIGELFQPQFRTHDHRHDGDDGVRRTRPRSAPSSRCRASCPAWRSCGSLARPAQEQIISGVQSFQEFGGLAGRIAPGVSRGPDRRPAPAAPPVSDSRHDPAAARVSVSSDEQPGARSGGASSSSG